MIQDDRFQAAQMRGGKLGGIVRPAVGGYQQPGTIRDDPPDCGQGQTVALLDAVRNIGPHLRPETLEHAGQQSGRGQAVDIVIAEDRDGAPAPDRGVDPLDGQIEIRERVGISQVAHPRLQERLSQMGTGDAATVENDTQEGEISQVEGGRLDRRRLKPVVVGHDWASQRRG
jgi:hypothetical protein